MYVPELTCLKIQEITFCKNLEKCTFPIIYDSVNLLPKKMKFTPGGKFIPGLESLT